MRTMRIAFQISAILFAGASAQSQTKSSIDATLAHELIARAGRIDLISQFPEAARLYEKAAALLPPTDPQAAHAIRMAAHLQHYIGSPHRAQALMERAAQLFSATGDIGNAASVYVDATFLALKVRDRGEARRFIDLAMMLIASPKVSEEQRISVLRRLSTPLAVLTAAPR